jgi:8-oxo-dGTP diphosphatase
LGKSNISKAISFTVYVLNYFYLMVAVKLITGESIPGKLSYVVIAARHGGGWLFVRHRRRGGWEMPAGHPDGAEGSVEAAARELEEETGAVDFIMTPVSYYSVDVGQGTQYGRLFLAEISRLGEVRDSDEIERVRVFRRLPGDLSLPEVMRFLYRIARKHAAD